MPATPVEVVVSSFSYSIENNDASPTTSQMRILQLNLNHCEAAQDLLYQRVREQHIDVAILCEQYKNLDGNSWVSDVSGRAAVCYAYPSITIEDFANLLDRIVLEASYHKPAIIAGDFNAWATEWGSRLTNRRGEVLLEAFAQMSDMLLMNTGKNPTFTRAGRSSIIDLTFVNGRLHRIATWKVCGFYTNSDHQAILITLDTPTRKNSSRWRTNSWNTKTFDGAAFTLMLGDECKLKGSGEDKTRTLTSFISGACDAAMTRLRPRKHHSSVYWWTDTIGDLRRCCNQARRRYQRARRLPEFSVLQEEFKRARRNLRQAIKESKGRCWRELCDEVDTEPCGRPYKIALKKLCKGTMQHPTRSNVVDRPALERSEEIHHSRPQEVERGRED
ncbi:uncharacterized protein [Halyomorpha halys]|uniref:uncharacterized protein n=1 Tax=Halyomorpha halys TaxID=286706 RepID=UPI0034D26867